MKIPGHMLAAGTPIINGGMPDTVKQQGPLNGFHSVIVFLSSKCLALSNQNCVLKSQNYSNW